MKDEATFHNIPTGYHSFYVKCVDYMYDGYKEQTIYPMFHIFYNYLKEY